jgi:hypothetical protein
MAASGWSDALGTIHHTVTGSPRIVSLVPSVTELLCELGLAHWLVGRTGFCIHPAAQVAGIAKVGGTKDVNVEKIRRLAPTHLVVNIDENEKPTVEALAQFIPHVIVTHPLAPHDNLALFRLLGGIFQAGERAETLCAEFETAQRDLLARRTDEPRNVLYCVWKDPWMTVSDDTYIARMLALIDWRQVTVTGAARYPVFDWQPGLLDEIDLVLLSSEPYQFTQAHVDHLQRELGKPVLLVDGEMLSWYGSRAIAGLHYLAGLTAWSQA